MQTAVSPSTFRIRRAVAAMRRTMMLHKARMYKRHRVQPWYTQERCCRRIEETLFDLIERGAAPFGHRHQEEDQVSSESLDGRVQLIAKLLTDPQTFVIHCEAG
mmetsp:Transcript_32579/g.49852  ORF Transcript_32579/g.49852 Transcript_32579/m.49852 type:complete len:104 (-) Transcript_32579:772-1083(-)